MHLLGLGDPDEIGNACIYLLSDASRWVTGSNLVVDVGVYDEVKSHTGFFFVTHDVKRCWNCNKRDNRGCNPRKSLAHTGCLEKVICDALLDPLSLSQQL